ncbi:serine protease [Williamsia sp. CHRR-6]|uniref:serine protease n=1 Tax=Williamsia sp. CHRR-6 TaxID=2835871 RepID=UPI001BD9F874|nr:serine protease [Williamsia sp. CHRR-6]MBT0565446.1 serine protease [Williamsia sp. CHRR-6]
MVKKTAALLATVLSTVLMLWGAGTASAAPSVFVGGGSGIVILQSGDQGEACTLTTIGKDSSNRLIGLTAGHCGNVGQLVFSERYANRGPIGRIIVSNNPLDFAVIAFDAAKVAPVRSVGGVTIRSIQTAAPQFPAVLCKTGRTTGRTCGVTFFSDNANHYSAICVAEGDSGSPVVIGDRLVGMVNAYFFTACIGPETGSNIGPILAAMKAAGVQGYRVI